MTTVTENEQIQNTMIPCSNTLNHDIDNCKTCKVLNGLSKASVLTQDQVSVLFTRGIDDKHTSTNHLVSDQGTLWHYDTIEAIRCDSGLVISNTQCWSAGFAKCPRLESHYSLPLSALSSLLDNTAIKQTLRIIDHKDNSTVFMCADRCFIFGYDQGPFMVEISTKEGTPSNLNDAYDALKPDIAKNAEFERQGDLFFVKISKMDKTQIKDIQTQKYVKREIERYDSATNTYAPKTIKELVRIELLDSRHQATKSAMLDNNLIVIGKVYHPEHKTLSLDSWYFVAKNKAVQSCSVQPRQSLGMD